MLSIPYFRFILPLPPIAQVCIYIHVPIYTYTLSKWPKNVFALNPIVLNCKIATRQVYCYLKVLPPLMMAFQRVSSLVLGKDIPSCKTWKRLFKRFKAQSQRKNLQLYKRKCSNRREGIRRNKASSLICNKEYLSSCF